MLAEGYDYVIGGDPDRGTIDLARAAGNQAEQPAGAAEVKVDEAGHL